MTTEQREYGLFINGSETRSDREMAVINPSTEQVFASCAQATEADLDRAVLAADQAQRAWGSDPELRRECLAQAADLLDVHVDELARTLTMEQGKPLKIAEYEVSRSAMWLRYYAQLPDEATVLRDAADRLVVRRTCPLGVVGTITPWNYPVFILIWKLAPALRAGNTLIAKPSPFTPISSVAVARVLTQAFPSGVFNVLPGDDDLGGELVLHPGIAKVSFTGSTATGRRVMASAAAGLKPVTLELGGNDAAVLLPDADPEFAAKSIFWNAFTNSGQICNAIKRVYVHEKSAPEFLDRLVDLAETTKVGDGLDPNTELGPLNNARQLERVSQLVDEARAGGAKVLSGGARLPQPGYFYPPTIVTGAAPDARLVAEEQFGPALPVVTYSNVQNAIDGANASPYGLGCSVWTSDLARGEQVAKVIEAGTVWINQHRDLLPYAPVGGWGESGLGYESGREGYEEFVKLQVINTRRSRDAPDGLDNLRHSVDVSDASS